MSYIEPDFNLFFPLSVESLLSTILFNNQAHTLFTKKIMHVYAFQI